MEYNTCSWCGAKDGRAGLLIKGMCINCADTKESGNIVIHAHLHRTSEELAKTMELVAGQAKAHEDKLAKEAYEAQIDAIVEMINNEAKRAVIRRGIGNKVRLDMAKTKIANDIMQAVEKKLNDE